MKIFNKATDEVYAIMAEDGITETTGTSESYENGWVLYYGENTDEYLIYEGYDDIDYMFMTTEDFAKYLADNPGKEVGFTNDKPADIDSEATGWHGAILGEMFDGWNLFFGYYGGGCEAVYSEIIRSNTGMILHYIERYFDVEYGYGTDGIICVYREDVERR